MAMKADLSINLQYTAHGRFSFSADTPINHIWSEFFFFRFVTYILIKSFCMCINPIALRMAKTLWNLAVLSAIGLNLVHYFLPLLQRGKRLVSFSLDCKGLPL